MKQQKFMENEIPKGDDLMFWLKQFLPFGLLRWGVYYVLCRAELDSRVVRTTKEGIIDWQL